MKKLQTIVDFFNSLSFSIKTSFLVFVVAGGMLTIIVLSLFSTYTLKQDFDNLFDKRTQSLIKLENIKDNYKVNIQESIKDVLNKEISIKQADEVILLATQLIEKNWNRYKAESKIQKEKITLIDFIKTYIIQESTYAKNINLQNRIIHNIDTKIATINTIIKNFDQTNIGITFEQVNLQINTISIYITSLINYELSLAIEEKRNTEKVFENIMNFSIVAIMLVFLFSIIFSVIIITHFEKLHNSLEEKVEEKTKELMDLNNYLEIKISKEVAQSRKKDIIMFQQARHAALGEMLGNIAHQWRQPLGSIMMIIQSFQTKMKRGKLSFEFVEDKVKDALFLAQNMSNTLEDFKNFFSPNKKKESFFIHKCIEHSLELSKYLLTKENIQIELDIDKNIKINGYYNELSHVFLNMITNSKDALMSNREQNMRIISITLEYKDDKGIITIVDNGGGIDESIIPKVFEPYYTTKYKSAGTGIGLYMSKQMIEKHMEGTIEYNTITKDFFNQAFICSLFTIKLPAIKEK